MQSEKSLKRINELLAVMVTEIKADNAMGLFDKNRVAEDLLIPIFSIIYDYKKLQNLNTEGENFEGIDLGDKVAKVAFQISSSVNNKKVKDTLTSIVKKEYFNEYESFKIYDITEKQSSYSGSSWKEIIDGKFTFTDKDILDFTDVAELSRHLPEQKISEIEAILERQFGANLPKGNLPDSIPQIRGFIGREKELKELRDWYDNGTRSFVIHGFGGIGKTATTLKLANVIKQDFDARLFINLPFLTDTEITSDNLIAQVVKQFIPDLDPALSSQELNQRYISLINKYKTLIVVDNVKSRNVVEPLNQSESCIIATTREAFVLTGGKGKYIDLMSPEDARKLLFSIADEERFDGQADKIAYLSGYVPMALLPLASLLAENEMENVSDLLKKYEDRKIRLSLADPNRDNLTVFASFELSYDELSEEFKNFWRKLSVFAYDFNEYAAVSIWDILEESEKGIETLKLLNKYNLIKGDRKTKRYKLHDLARDFLLEKCSQQELDELLQKHSKHYMTVLGGADYINKSLDFKSALKWLDVDSKNILIGQEWSAKNLDKNEEVTLICLGYAMTAFSYIKLRLHPETLISWQKSGIEAAQKRNDLKSQVMCQNYLGLGYLSLSKYNLAIKAFENSKEITEKLGDMDEVNVIMGYLSLAYKGLGDISKAIRTLEDCLIVSKRQNDSFLEFNSTSNLIPLYRINGEYEKSLDLGLKLLKNPKLKKDIQLKGIILGNIGSAYFALEDYKNAEKYYLEALELAREISDKQGYADRLGNLGNVYDKLGKLDKSRTFHEEALSIHKENGHRRGEAGDLGNIGALLIKQENTVDALGYFQSALEIAREIGDKQIQAYQLENIGYTYLEMDDLDELVKYWSEAIELYEYMESEKAILIKNRLDKIIEFVKAH